MALRLEGTWDEIREMQLHGGGERAINEVKNEFLLYLQAE